MKYEFYAETIRVYHPMTDDQFDCSAKVQIILSNGDEYVFHQMPQKWFPYESQKIDIEELL